MLNDDGAHAIPPMWQEIAARSNDFGFDMPSDARTGALLKVLAATKPGGRLLELGTGTGLATACLLAGMRETAQLVSIDNSMQFQQIARDALGSDPRVIFHTTDALDFLRSQPVCSFDLVFADAWPGKYEGLDEALALVRPGGLYIGDDMLPQDNWSAVKNPQVAE